MGIRRDGCAVTSSYNAIKLNACDKLFFSKLMKMVKKGGDEEGGIV